jgi:chaperonin GroES
MKIRPLHDRVVVKRMEEERTSPGGIVIPDAAAEKPIKGEIVAVGNGKIQDSGEIRALDVKVGDQVLFGKYAGTEVKVDGDEVVIANVDGEYFAFSNTCTHEGGPLSDGELEGDIVTCPWHFTPFNVKTGEAQEGGMTDDPVPTYEVRLSRGDIQIRKP